MGASIRGSGWGRREPGRPGARMATGAAAVKVLPDAIKLGALAIIASKRVFFKSAPIFRYHPTTV
jgi:hypothetical protein